jgi:hypothetical protein
MKPRMTRKLLTKYREHLGAFCEEPVDTLIWTLRIKGLSLSTEELNVLSSESSEDEEVGENGSGQLLALARGWSSKSEL